MSSEAAPRSPATTRQMPSNASDTSVTTAAGTSITPGSNSARFAAHNHTIGVSPTRIGATTSANVAMRTDDGRPAGDGAARSVTAIASDIRRMLAGDPARTRRSRYAGGAMTSDTDAASLTIRRAEPADGDGIGDVWLAAWRVTYDFPPGHPDEDVRRWLVEHLVPTHETWVAVDGRERVVALMALSDTMVEQLYVAPDWIGRGLGSRLLDLAKTRRPARARAVDLPGQPAGTAVLRAPRVRRGRTHGRLPERGAAAGPALRLATGTVRAVTAIDPTRLIASRDGTPIAVFASGDGPPLILVHGTAADHTTFRVLGPLLAKERTVHAIDRRGRGASGDTPPYDIEREFEDVVAVAETLAAELGGAVDVFGHSYGGRCALGAATRTDAIGRVVSYEGAPTPAGITYGDASERVHLEELAAAGDFDTLLATFMTRVVGMTAGRPRPLPIRSRLARPGRRRADDRPRAALRSRGRWPTSTPSAA